MPVVSGDTYKWWDIPPHTVAVSVKVGEDHKRRLDRLREDLKRLRGEAITAQEVLERLIDIGAAKPDLVLETYSRVKYPLPPARIRAIHAIADDWGGVTSEEDIDATLYGGRRRRRS